MTLSAPPPDSDDITNVILTELKWITQGTYKADYTVRLECKTNLRKIQIHFRLFNNPFIHELD